MKHAKMTLCLMLISVLLVSTWVPLMNPTTSNMLTPDSKSEVVPSYVSHGYIDITGDTDFNDTATAESWTGDGSSGDPFIIEGYEIVENEVLIEISDTRYHFEIRDCNLTLSLGAIVLDNVTNGLIENCIISDAYFDGIYMDNVTGIDVVNCHISLSDEEPGETNTGINMHECIDCCINGTVIEGFVDSDAGIYGGGCDGITLFNNTVFEFDLHGIYFEGCVDMDVLNNTLYWNEGMGGGETCGMYIFDSFLIDIIGNNVTENSDNGITILGSNNVTILENTLVENEYFGIQAEFSDYCVIQGNWIKDNGNEGAGIGSGVYIDSSEYCEILENTFLWNLLSSITLVDADFSSVSNNYLNHSYTHGIELQSSHNVTIEENEIYNAYGFEGPACGIYVDGSDNSSLINNILGYNSENGITIVSSDYGEAVGNTIFDSENQGISLLAGSFWTLFDNVIYDNGGPGIYLYGMSADCLVYHNDIGWSGEFLTYDAGTNNDWNYTDIGNWYSDYDGIGSYDHNGGPSLDHHPSRSLYCGVTDVSEYQAGTTGNTMTWNSSALNPWKYEVLIDSEPQGPVDWDGGNIAADVDGLAVGEYNVTLVVYHVSGHWLSNQSTLTVIDTLGPEWNVTIVNQYLEFGASCAFTINATDPSGVDSYWLTGDGNFTIDSSGLITNTTFLVVDMYEISVHVNDTFGHETLESLYIHVTDTIDPVWVTTPTDQAIDQGEEFSYQLYATDLAGIVLWNVNNTDYFAISADGLITNIIPLDPGVYHLNITVVDGNLNSLSIVIEITVNAVAPTTTDTTTTETPPPLDPAMVALAIGGVGVIVLIGGVVFILKKKSG
ncbi:MAG: right-handed parallel beta-helix repeat-containing protein [Candidatus Thorarchaeota archaeon]